MRHVRQTIDGSQVTDRLTQVRRQLDRASSYGIERLESRLLLNATLRAGVAGQVDPATAQQTLFVPGVSVKSGLKTGAVGVVSSNLFRFTLDDATQGQTTTFSVTGGNDAQIDNAIALYDGNGNLLQVADNDNPAPGTEQLTVSLDSRTPYVLGIYSRNLVFANQSVTLTTDTGAQRVNSTIKIDPATGTADFLANAGEDTFNSPTDVNYFPLDLTNAGASATITITAAGPDTVPFAVLYRQDTPGINPQAVLPFRQVDSGSGQTVTLKAQKGNVFDALDQSQIHYVLAVAPSGFNTAAQPYEVKVASAALLGPATVSPAAATDLGPLLPISAGTADLKVTGSTAGGAKLYQVRAVADGPLTFSVLLGALAMNVYDATGTTMLGAEGISTGGVGTVTVNATAGTIYLVRVGNDPIAPNAAIAFTFEAKQTYAGGTAIAVGNTPGQQTGLTAAPQVFRLTPPAGADLLVLQLVPDASADPLAPGISVVGANQPVVQKTAAAGSPLTLVVDLNAGAGLVDVVTYGTAGSGTATLSYAALTLPRQLAIDQLPSVPVDLKTGQASSTVDASTFGQLNGVQFYQINGSATTIKAQGSAGVQPLLVRYAQQGGILKLADKALPDANGMASLSTNLQGTLFYVAAAIPLNPSGNGTVQLSVSEPPPPGVGVGTVPEPHNPGDPFKSFLRIRDVVLQHPNQRDLFETLLPGNMTSNPVLTIGPTSKGSPLAVKVTVLDANNNVLITGTSQPGQQLALDLGTANPPITPASFAGKKLRFLIEPVAGQPLGDGVYTLQVEETTTDPSQYLLDGSDLSFGPNTPVSFGGTADGNFSGTAPQIQLFRLQLPNTTTPFQVWTEDLDPTANTDIRLYRVRYKNTPPFFAIDKLESLNSITPSLDYFPADRSSVDSKIVVTNTHVLDHIYDNPANNTSIVYSPGTNTLYLAVENQEGSTGRFRVHFEAVPTTTVGPGQPDPVLFGGSIHAPPITIDPESGQGTVTFVGHEAVPFSTPHSLASNPVAIIQSPNFNDFATVDLYDNSGNFLTESNVNVVAGVAIVPFNYTMAPSNLYFIKVFLSSGAGANQVTISASVSTANSPNPPAHNDSLTDSGSFIDESEPFNRAVQAPDGSFVQNDRLLLGSGTMDKVVFYVPAAGAVHFSASPKNISNFSFALYRGFENSSEVGFHYGGILLDFTSTPNADGTYSFDDYLTAGFYYLKTVGAVPGNPAFSRGADTINATLPAFNAQHITLDPQFADNSSDNLQTLDKAFDTFGTSLYELEAPGAVQSSLKVNFTGLTGGLPQGEADFAIFKRAADGTYTRLIFTPYIAFDTNPAVPTTVADSQDAPVPGDQYFISINRDRMGGDILAAPAFTVPHSGDPDLAVQSVALHSDFGRTQVIVTVKNQAFAPAPFSNGLFTFSNYNYPKDPAHPNFPPGTVLRQSGVGPLGTITYVTDWDPDNPQNTVSYTANFDQAFTEISFANNSAKVALSTVDKSFPTVGIALSDPSLSAEGGTWGRYVAGVSGVQDDVILNTADQDGDLYISRLTGPFFIGSTGNLGVSHSDRRTVDFGTLSPTSAQNPNLIDAYAQDAFGLKSSHQFQKIDVVPKSQFFTSITWDPAAKDYNLAFDHDVVNLEGTINDLIHKGVNIDLPVIGDKSNQFRITFTAHGTAGLDPTKAVSLPLFTEILIRALGFKIFDPTFGGTQQLTDNLTLRSTVEVSGRTLDATAAALSLQLRNLTLLHFKTPQIPVFSFGLPGIASIDASVGFGLDATLNAGLKIGIDPKILVDPLHAPLRAGLMSPTFINPRIQGSATVEGDVDVLGFDAASLQGTLTLGLDVNFGLDNNDPSKVIPFSDLLDHLALKLGLIVGVHLEADVIIVGDVWDYDYSKTIPVIDTSKEGIITTDTDGRQRLASVGKLLSNPTALLQQAAVDGAPPVVRKGSDPLGPYQIDPTPQLIVDPNTGDGLSVQVRNVSQDPNVTTGNLVYSARSNGQWGALTPLNSGDVANPALAFSHDRDNLNPAVVVYEADNGAGDPASQSLNQRLDDIDIRYRYYDGEGNWGDEQSITNDSLNDSSPSVAFNAAGAGVAAWVHNTSATPMDESGNYSRNTQDIQAAVWDPSTHTFSAPLNITAGDGVADYKPATFVDDDGNPYVVWVRDTQGGGNTLMYSIFDGQQWSQPAVLPITGLTPGGSFGNVALGRDQLGRINVIFSYRIPNADGSVDSRLFNRPGTKDQFGSPTPVEQVAQGGNFNHLRTTHSGDGSLVAYWQLGDGVNNGVYESTLARSAANPNLPWSPAIRLTSTSNLTMTPSVAVDSGGKFDVLFENSAPKGAVAPAVVNDVPADVPLVPGVGSSSVAALPELTFTNGLFFPYQDSAAAGTTTQGQATITNRGPVAAQVTVDSFVGTPDAGVLIDTRHITLGPGDSYSYSQLFPVSAGSQTYSVRVSSATGEAVSTDDDVSTATLNGVPDITITSLDGPANPTPGQQVTLNAQVKNLSNVPVDSFLVTLFAGDPLFPQTNPVALGTQTVAALAPGATTTVSFTITLPATAGDYVFTAQADSGNAIAEATEGNNTAQYKVAFHADPAILPRGLQLVRANLLDASGVNNVSVTVPMANLGNVDAANVPVILQLSRDGSDFVNVATQTVPLIQAGSGTTISFITNGLAGDNIYRVMIDPAFNASDNNIENNFGQAELVIHGVADLSVPSINLSNSNPPQGTPLIVTAVVANTGIADANDVLVELFATPDGGDPIPVGSLRLDQVPALSQTVATFAVDTGKLSGHYSLLVQVNRLHEVLEATELNNTATTDFTVGPPVAIPTSNVVNGVAGIANTITLRRDPADSTKDDVWVNIAETELPTQFARVGQPITVNSGGGVDKLVLDLANGDPLPVELDLNGSFTTDALAINAGESVVLEHTAALYGNQLTVTGLTIDPAGKLDVGDGSVRVAYAGASPLSALRGYLASGYSGGAWTGDGITSSDAAAHTGNALGTADDGTAVTIKYTRAGDADVDGKVSFSDLLALAQHYNAPDAGWSQGDFNYDGKVTFTDLLVLAQQYNQSATATSHRLKLRAARRQVVTH